MKISYYVSARKYEGEYGKLDISFPEIPGYGKVHKIAMPAEIASEIIYVGPEENPMHQVALVCVANPAAWLASDFGEDITMNGLNLKDLVREEYANLKDQFPEG